MQHVTKPRTGGAPRKAPGGLTKNLHLKVSRGEHKKLREMAKERRQSMGDVVRAWLGTQ